MFLLSRERAGEEAAQVRPFVRSAVAIAVSFPSTGGGTVSGRTLLPNRPGHPVSVGCVGSETNDMDMCLLSQVDSLRKEGRRW